MLSPCSEGSCCSSGAAPSQALCTLAMGSAGHSSPPQLPILLGGSCGFSDTWAGLAIVQELMKMLSLLLKPDRKSICSHCSSRKCLGTSLGLSLSCLLCPEPCKPTSAPLTSLVFLGGFRGCAYLPPRLLSSCDLHMSTSAHGSFCPSYPVVLTAAV